MSDSISASNLSQNPEAALTPVVAPVSVTPHSAAAHSAAPLNETVSSPNFVREMFRGWPRILAWTVGGVVVVALGTTLGLYSHWQNSGRIAPDVRVQGVDLSGLSRDEARLKLRERFAKTSLRIRTPDGLNHLPLSALGGAPQIERMIEYSMQHGRSERATLITNIERAFTTRDDSRFLLPIRWDKTQMRRVMYGLNAKYAKPSRNARLEFAAGTLNVVAEERGSELNVGATLRDLQKKYYLGMPILTATTRDAIPKITAADLAGRNLEIGRYRTRFNAGEWGRTRNIEVASERIDGHVMMPGETFSFNKMTGERTWDKGYRMAHIFETKPGALKAEVVDGLAGGVCQVSSTLYNAVRKANNKTDGGLKIVERESHSLPVSYVPSGLDATVAWPNRDFKFRNSYDFPIYLRSQVDGSRLIVSVWGRVPATSSTRFASLKTNDD